MATPNHHPQIEKMIPLSEASHYRPELPQLIKSGTIGATMYNDVILVSEAVAMAELPKVQRPEYLKHSHLAGVGIGMREASRKYNVHVDTISGWVSRNLIAVLAHVGKQKMMLDEADVAYCVEIRLKNPGRGKRIFNPDGTPHQ